MEFIENAFEKIKKVGGYPSPFVSQEQKEKKEYEQSQDQRKFTFYYY